MVLLWGSIGLVNYQPLVIINGTTNTCLGVLLDSCGEEGSGYANNENFTNTICPDNPRDAISLNFITAHLNTSGAAPEVNDKDNYSGEIYDRIGHVTLLK